MQNIRKEVRTEIIFKKRKNPNFLAHVHDDIELCYVIKGGGTAICNGKRHTLKERCFFVAFPYQVHQYVDFEDGEYVVLITKPTKLLTFGDVFLQNDPENGMVDFQGVDDDHCVALLLTALAEYERDGHNPVIDGYLTTLFLKLLKHLTLHKKQSPGDLTLQILDYCLQHYRDPISVDTIAAALHISRSSVSHIFSSRLAIGFNDYINSLRLADGVNLLKTTKNSVTEIASMTGFGTIRTFNRAFLKRYGISPSEYRKQCFQ